jgi:hypothetical protein
MKDNSTNKWLIIIIILFICFIIIPILMKLFNITEGATNRQINDNVNDAKRKINDANNKLNTANSTINTVKSATDDIKATRAINTAAIKQNDDTNTEAIKANDNSNLNKIITEIQGLKASIPTNTGAPVDFSPKFEIYNTNLAKYNESLGSLSGQIGGYNDNLNKGAAALTSKIGEFNGNIVAYNTANLANATAVSAMDTSIKDTSGKYLETNAYINKNIDAINTKLQTFDPDALNRTMMEYNAANLELVGKIMQKMESYEQPVLNYKKVLNKRLLISENE